MDCTPQPPSPLELSSQDCPPEDVETESQQLLTEVLNLPEVKDLPFRDKTHPSTLTGETTEPPPDTGTVAQLEEAKAEVLSKLTDHSSLKLPTDEEEDEPTDEEEDVATDEEEDEPEPTQEEELAAIAREEEISDGEDCEFHFYECRENTRGEEVYLRAGRKFTFDPPKQRSHRACLVLTRYYDDQGKRKFSGLEIQSRHVIRALREVTGTHGRVDYTGKVVEMFEPPMDLFHYRSELAQYTETSDNQQLKSHLKLCLQYAEKTLHRELKAFESLNLSSPSGCALEHRYLWMLFKPGSLAYVKEGSVERLYRVLSIDSTHEPYPDNIGSWKIVTEYISPRAKELGHLPEEWEIKSYAGTRLITELPVVPLHLHPEQKRIRDDLLERGRKFLYFCRRGHCSYTGSARLCQHASPSESDLSTTSVRGRIMIDPEEYDNSVARKTPSFIPGTATYDFATDIHLSDEDAMICFHSLPGYSLDQKRWGLFLVSGISDVAYNDKAIEQLVLPDQKRKLICSLVGDSSSSQGGDDFDDLIQGKGKGLVVLCHGPPGVGKTYTAESIADHTRRPLLKITSGELLLDGLERASAMEVRLSALFSLVTKWNGILLLDEADVFMMDRSTTYNVFQNSLVAMLLRVLEYCEGIIFLTTNRVKAIDPAFKSRIHLAIAYPNLSAESQSELWKTMITRANGGELPDWLTVDALKQLAETKTNGREIRNVTRMACTLALNEQRKITHDDILKGVDAMKQFELDFSRRVWE